MPITCEVHVLVLIKLFLVYKESTIKCRICDENKLGSVQLWKKKIDVVIFVTVFKTKSSICDENKLR